MRNTYLQQCDYGSRFRILKGGKISLVVSAFIASVTLLQAAPTGGVVTSGTATIAQSGSVTNITQSTQKAAINWQNFSIGATETVNFNQPNASSITLNRVVGNEKSIIDGALNANGQVFILNSNGLLFSKNASINTAGLVATTMNLSDADFNAGNYAFKGDSSASIINQGTINISDKGYAALFGKEVINEGVIRATLGKVELVGAKEVTLNLNGNSLVNLKVDKGVLDALVENKGAIYADGGEVYLTTNAVNELLKGVVNNTGIVEAQTLDDIAGKIILFAHGGEVQVGGTLKAEGGFIETSGKEFRIAEGTTIKAKEWLIDPVNITIDAALASTLVGQLATGDATVTTDGADADEGNIYVNSAITWATDKRLTLAAANSIFVNATISNTNITEGGVRFEAFNTSDKVDFGANGKVIINNRDQLEMINRAFGGRYELGRNIDLTVASWTPIGNSTDNFTGSFDGRGYTIDHLTMNRPTTDYQGLFGVTAGATISNVGLTNVNIVGQNRVGGLVGYANDISGVRNTTITNSYVTGTVSGTSYIGGLVGSADHSTAISGSYSTGTVSGTNSIGGLVGYAYHSTTISGSHSAATVSGYSSIGGLVGESDDSTITNSYATGNVTATVEDSSYIGGLVGLNDGATIENSYATGIVKGNESVGGLVGSNEYSSTITNSYATGIVEGIYVGLDEVPSYIGGLVGFNFDSTIENSYATGSVSGTIYIGGLVGKSEYDEESTTIRNSYATGSVSGNERVGGLVGENGGGTIEQTYATGLVTGTSLFGGLVGNNSGTITNSFRDTQTNGTSTAGTGKTTAELKQMATFTGWSIRNSGVDASETWRIYEGYTNPLLVTFMIPVTKYGTTGYSEITPSFWHSSAYTDATKVLGTSPNFYSSQMYYDLTIDARDLILDNGAMRFGSGTTSSFSNKGVLLQPFYKDGTYKKLTYVSYPLDMIFGAEGVGTSEWNSNGSFVKTYDNDSVTNLSTPIYNVSQYNFATKSGIIVVKNMVTINGTLLEMSNAYNLEAGKSVIATTTTFKNIDTTTAENIRLWVGTRDDYLATDSPTKVKGNMNLTTNEFTATTAQGDRAKAIKITNPNDSTIGIYLYSDAATADTLMISPYSNYENTTSTNPRTSELTHAGDDTYSLYARFSDLAVGASSSITWYYAGGKLDSLFAPAVTVVVPPTQDLTPIITQIVNNTAIQPPVMPNFTPPTPPAPPSQQFSFGGQQVQLASTPNGDTPSQIVGMQEARAMMQGGGAGDIRIPLGQNSLIQLVNGGVRLPNGIEQEFFMAQN